MLRYRNLTNVGSDQQVLWNVILNMSAARRDLMNTVLALGAVRFERALAHSHVLQSMLPVLCFILVVRSTVVYSGCILTAWFVDVHTAGWLIEYMKRALHSSSALGFGSSQTGRARESLNPDGTLRSSSGIKLGLQRPVLGVQLYCATKFTFRCYSKNFKGFDKICVCVCVTACQKDAWISTILFILLWFILASTLLSIHVERRALVIALSFRIFILYW
jgi:hypothetical protein